jgi:hypothetical protein
MLKSDMDGMFKFDDEMFEDDWNDGTYIYVQQNAQAHGTELENKVSVAEAKNGSHDVEVTTGAKFNAPWADGIESQAEFTHSNKVKSEFDLVTSMGGVSTYQTY